MSETKQLIRNMVENWREEYNSIKEQLIIRGAEAHKNEYNLLAAEAMTLLKCMNDAGDLLVELAERAPNTK